VPTAAETCALALHHHQAGNLRQAEQLYRQILQADPDNADAHHLLGALAYQLGRHEQAMASIGQALTLKPGVAAYHSNLGLARQALGQMDEALACFQEALRLQPDSPVAHSNLANALLRQGKPDEAVIHYRQALRLRPNFADAHCGLGLALAAQGDMDQAVFHYRQAIGLNPDFAEAHNNLANALLSQGKLDEAVIECRQALRVRPDYAEAHNNLGNALQKQGQLEEAVTHFHQALRLRPDFPEAHNNLANVLKIQGSVEEAMTHCYQALRLQPDSAEAHNTLGNALVSQGQAEEAVTHFEEALRLRPGFAEAHNNLGIALMSQGKQEDAMTHFQEALRSQPDLPEAHYDRSILLLLRGDFGQGWAEYEWRWRQPRVAVRSFPQPLWDGSPLNDRTILVHAEQGLGDTMQFIRYVPLVKQRGGKVIVECHPPLLRLLASAAGVDQLVARGSALPEFDVQAPLLSLPRIFQTSLVTIPKAVPYLQADAELVQRWKSRKSEVRSPKSEEMHLTSDFRLPTSDFLVGIAWQGNTIYPADRQRSIPLAHFSRLAQVPGVQLISLQKGPGSDQLRGLPTLTLPPLDETTGAFMDTAAVMKSLDLVISSDTAVAHLAGALGVPVWVALPLVPDWRWLLEREDSPWYPTMRLFRQTRYSHWEDVFERLAAELKTVVSCQLLENQLLATDNRQLTTDN